MSEPPPSRPQVTPSRAIAGVCLIIPFVAMLWVGSFTRKSPAFIGIPFFYWYQMAWVLGSTVLTSIAYVLVRREERARRQAGAPLGGDAA
jgi:FtsH-binding integral membrane protein